MSWSHETPSKSTKKWYWSMDWWFGPSRQPKWQSAAIITTKLWSTAQHGAAGSVASSFADEMEAITIGQQYTAPLVKEHGEKVRALTDSLSSIEKLSGGPEKQTTRTGVEIWKVLNKMKECTFVWVPSHCNIEGNERVDRDANIATTLNQEVTLSLQTAKALIGRDRKKINAQYFGEWQKLQKRPGNIRNRWEEVNWNQFQTGHSSLARADLHRFGIVSSDECTDCGEPHTVDHILRCQRGDRFRQALTRTADDPQQLLNDPGKLFGYLRTMCVWCFQNQRRCVANGSLKKKKWVSCNRPATTWPWMDDMTRLGLKQNSLSLKQSTVIGQI